MTQDIDKLVADLNRHRDAHVSGYPTPRRDVAEAFDKATDAIVTLAKRLEEAEALIDGEGCPAADRIGALFSRAETAEARAAQLEAENERLMKLLRRYRTETPLHHQPHMISREADAAIRRLDEVQDDG